MKAVAVFPSQREISLISHPSPVIFSPNHVKVRTLEVGVCGTDREISSFAYGSPPVDSDYLIIGHEAIGSVADVGTGVSRFKLGDLVVPSVRRPCPHNSCPPCLENRQDYCSSGDFSERGIKKAHGLMSEYFLEDEHNLFLVPEELREIAVLIEPLSIAEKALAQVWQFQNRLPWVGSNCGDRIVRGNGKTAVVLGAGPIGILGAMLLVIHGFRTFVYSRSPTPNFKATLCGAFGATYLSTKEICPEELGGYVGGIDLIYEAVGFADITFEVMKMLGANGVMVLTGIPSTKPPILISADLLMRDMVLKNQGIIGTVNADSNAFEYAIRDLGEFLTRWPEAIRKVITGRFPMGAYRELLLNKTSGIKDVISMGL